MSTGAEDERRRTFRLLARRHLIGVPFGQVPSRRRGNGSEVIGLRAYERGDPLSSIDWPATARLSATRGADTFVVRESAADEAPRIVLVIDRRPAMDLSSEPFPWLAKRDAARHAASTIAASARAAQADVAALDFDGDEPWWLTPGRRDRAWLIDERIQRGSFTAPETTLERSFAFLSRHRAQLPAGSFVFVLSDFLVPLSSESLRTAAAHGWDVVPVVIQDPTWERSFPEVGGIAIPIVEPSGRHPRLVRISRRQAAARREANTRRAADLVQRFTAFEMQPVWLETSVPSEIDARFIEWSDARSHAQRVR